MNQHINSDLMWKNQNLIQSTANGNAFDDKGYHGSEKVVCDRTLNNPSSFIQFNSKLGPTSKVKEYQSFNEVEPTSFIDGIYVHNSNNVAMSKMRYTSDHQQQHSDEFLWFYLDPRNNVQGPFLDSQMFQWWSQGIYFQNSLLMKRKCDADFSTLQDYSKRFNGVPFNRKDIRVPPLTESLTLLPSTHYYVDPKIYATNGQTMHRNPISMNDPNYILQLLSSVPNQSSPEELSKLLQKVNIQQRHPMSQMGYEQPTQNGTDSYVNNGGVTGASLSNFVNVRLSNPASQSYNNADISSKTSHIGNYMQNERFQNSSSWGTMPQQKLSDSVWMSTSEDTVISSNPLWSRSTNDTAVGVPSLLNSIFHDSQNHRQNNINIPTNSHQSLNPMQDSWANIDPAIIKIVPQGDSVIASAENNSKMLSRDISVSGIDQKTHVISSHKNSLTETSKHQWAELVRKSNNEASVVGNHVTKTGFNSDHDPITNHHSLSPNRHHRTSLTTSSSSDEYDQRTSESANKDLDSLIKWSISYLENKPGINGVDISTLIELLIYVESPYEVEATMRENVPEFDNICEFVKIFIEKRRPLRQKLFSENTKKKSKYPSLKVDDETKWQVKSKSQHGSCKKKRKNPKN